MSLKELIFQETQSPGGLSYNIKRVLNEKLPTYVFYSLALDKNTHQTDTAQLAIFVFVVDSNFDIFKELLSIASLKDHTTGENIFKALKKAIEFSNLCFENLAGIAIDRAPSMIGKYIGLKVF